MRFYQPPRKSVQRQQHHLISLFFSSGCFVRCRCCNRPFLPTRFTSEFPGGGHHVWHWAPQVRKGDVRWVASSSRTARAARCNGCYSSCVSLPAPPSPVSPPRASCGHYQLLPGRIVLSLTQAEALRRGKPARVIAVPKGFQEAAPSLHEHHQALPRDRIRGGFLRGGGVFRAR